MTNLTEEQICSLIDLRDEYAFAYLSYAVEKLGHDNLSTVQTLTTEYSQNLAQQFLEMNKEFFRSKENCTKIFKHITSCGAERPYSGKRFSQEFYKLLSEFVKTSNNNKGNEK